MACRMHGLYLDGHLIARWRAREPPCPEVQHRGHGVFHVSHHAFSRCSAWMCDNQYILIRVLTQCRLGCYTTLSGLAVSTRR